MIMGGGAVKQLVLLLISITTPPSPTPNSLTRSDRIEPMGEALAMIDFARAQVGVGLGAWAGGLRGLGVGLEDRGV